MLELEVLEHIEAASGTNEKIAILKQNKDNKQLHELLDAALSFNRKFFIKKFPVVMGKGSGATHAIFLTLLDRLERREITGDAAREAVSNFLYFCNELQLKWYSRVLMKDLRCNMSLSTVNKAGFDIPEFDVMLAKDGKECKNLKDIVSNGVYLSPKFDGYRCLAVCDRGTVTLYSRNGSEYENFPTIIQSLTPLCSDASFVLDGEIMSDDFNAMQQTAFSSKSNKTVGDVKYHVFGWIPFNEWTTQNFKAPTKNRLDNLKALFDQNKIPANLIRVEHKLVYQVEEILKFEQDCLAKGYEGAMALPNIPYFLGKKTGRLMKFKTMLSQDCKVVGMYEGEGKYVGTMGGIQLIQENGEKCDSGSGFTDEERDYMWNHREDVIGRIAEIKYQELTPDGIMRFAIFMRWRNDK